MTNFKNLSLGFIIKVLNIPGNKVFKSNFVVNSPHRKKLHMCCTNFGII